MTRHTRPNRTVANRNPTESPRCAVTKNQIVTTPNVRVPRIPTHRKKLISETSNPAKGSFLLPTGSWSLRMPCLRAAFNSVKSDVYRADYNRHDNQNFLAYDTRCCLAVRDTNAAWVAVQTGLTIDSYIEVLGDLKAGDRVVKAGTEPIHTARVQAQAPPTAQLCPAQPKLVLTWSRHGKATRILQPSQRHPK
jgi:hypothetical protein